MFVIKLCKGSRDKSSQKTGWFQFTYLQNVNSSPKLWGAPETGDKSRICAGLVQGQSQEQHVEAIHVNKLLQSREHQAPKAHQAHRLVGRWYHMTSNCQSINKCAVVFEQFLCSNLDRGHHLTSAFCSLTLPFILHHFAPRISRAALEEALPCKCHPLFPFDCAFPVKH